MDYVRFRKIAKDGEGPSVDFKETCEAFNSPTVAPRAELAKDICALANRGHVTGYILVGVSDDGKRFRSVKNPKLTDDNLQSFCKAAISPPPRVRLLRRNWREAPSEVRNKTFVIIQIGPNARHAYRLAQDFVDYREKVCLRRNEVWIRRGATSDLAAPEEIVRLARSEGEEDSDEPSDNVQYERLPHDSQTTALLRDFSELASELGTEFRDDGRVTLGKRGQRFVWRVIAARELKNRFEIAYQTERSWAYEHGVMILAVDGVTSAALPPPEPIRYKQKWGWFTTYEMLRHRRYRSQFQGRSLPEQITQPIVPENTTEEALPIVTLSGLRDTRALRASVLAMIQHLETDSQAQAALRKARTGVNRNLRRWLQKGWLLGTSHFFTKPPQKAELKKNEVYDRKRSQILVRVRSDYLTTTARNVLDLSRGR